MKYKKSTTKSKRSFLLPGIALIVVAAAITGYALWKHSGSNGDDQTSGAGTTYGKTDYSPATPAENSANEGRKGTSSGSETLNTGNSGGGAPSTSASVKILSANPSSTSRNLHVGTYVSGTNSGTCTLTANKAGQESVVKNSSVRLDVNTYSCGVFNISYDDFPASGDWSLILTLDSSGTTTSNTWTKPVTINK